MSNATQNEDNDYVSGVELSSDSDQVLNAMRQDRTVDFASLVKNKQKQDTKFDKVSSNQDSKQSTDNESSESIFNENFDNNIKEQLNAAFQRAIEGTPLEKWVPKGMNNATKVKKFMNFKSNWTLVWFGSSLVLTVLAVGGIWKGVSTANDLRRKSQHGTDESNNYDK